MKWRDTLVTGDANVKQFVFYDATSDQLSEAMKPSDQMWFW